MSLSPVNHDAPHFDAREGDEFEVCMARTSYTLQRFTIEKTGDDPVVEALKVAELYFGPPHPNDRFDVITLRPTGNWAAVTELTPRLALVSDE